MPEKKDVQASFDFMNRQDPLAIKSNTGSAGDEMNDQPTYLNDEQNSVPFEHCFAESDKDVGYKCSCCGGNLTEDVGTTYCPHCSHELSWDTSDGEEGLPWESDVSVSDDWQTWSDKDWEAWWNKNDPLST